MILEVPYIEQLNDHYCGPASLQMVLGFLGITIDQEELAKEIGTNEHGSDRDKIIEVARKHGFDIDAEHHATIEEIKESIDSGKPVLINNLDIERKEGHYVVVIGYDNSDLIVHDPWFGEAQKREIKDFMERWEERDNWLLSIK